MDILWLETLSHSHWYCCCCCWRSDSLDLLSPFPPCPIWRSVTAASLRSRKPTPGFLFTFSFLRILEHPDTASHPPTTVFKGFKRFKPVACLEKQTQGSLVRLTTDYSCQCLLSFFGPLSSFFFSVFSWGWKNKMQNLCWYLVYNLSRLSLRGIRIISFLFQVPSALRLFLKETLTNPCCFFSLSILQGFFHLLFFCYVFTFSKNKILSHLPTRNQPSRPSDLHVPAAATAHFLVDFVFRRNV